MQQNVIFFFSVKTHSLSPSCIHSFIHLENTYVHLLVPGTALGNMARHQFPGRMQGSGPREQGRGLGLPNSVFTSSNTRKAQCKDTVKTSSVHLLGRDEESSEKNSFYFLREVRWLSMPGKQNEGKEGGRGV